MRGWSRELTKGDGNRQAGEMEVAAGLSSEEGAIGQGERHGWESSRVHEMSKGR